MHTVTVTKSTANEEGGEEEGAGGGKGSGTAGTNYHRCCTVVNLQ